MKELPERQRTALVMREMAGLGFEQIGESLGASAPAARQTVYEANGVRQGERGTGAERGHGRHSGRPDGLPEASQRGQETAAAHKAPQAQASPGPGPTAGQGQGKSSKPAPQPQPQPQPQPPSSSSQQNVPSSPVEPGGSPSPGGPSQVRGGEKRSEP